MLLPEVLRIAIVPGVIITRWTRAWKERYRRTSLEVFPITQADQLAALLEERADLAFVRLPIEHESLSTIPLWTEDVVAVVSVDDALSTSETLTMADLAGQAIRDEEAEMAVQIVAAGTGVMIVPKAVARQVDRKDVKAIPITDAEPTQIALAWVTDRQTLTTENFIGIVRGRTANSSRGPQDSMVKPGWDASRTGGKARSVAPPQRQMRRTRHK